jgi:hypothetical protein
MIEQEFAILRQLIALEPGSRPPRAILQQISSLPEAQRVELFVAASKLLAKWIEETNQLETSIPERSQETFRFAATMIEIDFMEMRLRSAQNAVDILEPYPEHNLRGRVRFNKTFHHSEHIATP